MYVCYVDEAGCTGALPSANSPIQPVFTVAGLIVDQASIRSMTLDLMHLKQQFFPNLLPPGSLYNDWIGAEIKGADMRRMARSRTRNDRRFAYRVISSALDILAKHGASLVGRVYVKPIGGQFAGGPVYSSCVQRICTDFQNFLDSRNARGLVIADSRDKSKNANISHSIFTQAYRAVGNPYASLIEVPTFGHSDNHAGLQFADLICSALLFPIAAEVCCLPHMSDLTHCHAQHSTLRQRYGQALKNLQFRYTTSPGRWTGGITLSDPLNNFKATALFA